MRVLMTTSGGSGHLLPMVPFARACLRAGHEVGVAAQRSRAANVQPRRVAFAAFDDPPPEQWGPVRGSLASLPLEEANARMVRDVFASTNTRAALPGVLELVASWRPDVVVSEVSEFAGALAAERHGVPHARLSLGLAAMGEWMAPVVAEPLRAARVELGLPDDPGLRGIAASPYLTLTPPALEEPGDTGPAPVHRFRDEQASPAPASLSDPWPGGTGPLVYVSFGSVVSDMPYFPVLYRDAIDALARLPVRILMTTGNGADPAELGPLPANVRVERWVPQADVLVRAAAMVCHGGYGSTLGALRCGVPLVVLPLFSIDQWANARRVAAIGAGVALTGAPRRALDLPGAGVTGALPDAVRAVLGDPGYGRAARGIAAEMAALPPVGEAVGVLEALAEGAAEPRAA